MKASVLAAAAILLVGCRQSEPVQSVELSEITAILAEPLAYDGKLVRVQGAAVVRFEASFICPSPETLDSPDSSK
jgi:hypothetical protein